MNIFVYNGKGLLEATTLEMLVSSDELERLTACFNEMSPTSRHALLAEAQRLLKLDYTAAILKQVAKEKKGKRRETDEVGFDEFAAFMAKLPVNQAHAARIWKALAMRSGKLSGVRQQDQPALIRQLRFEVSFIRGVVQRGASWIGNSVGPEIFEILKGWEKTL